MKDLVPVIKLRPESGFVFEGRKVFLAEVARHLLRQVRTKEPQQQSFGVFRWSDIHGLSVWASSGTPESGDATAGRNAGIVSIGTP